ncbi:arsenical pump-driving ATPase [Salmonella enterica subsp. enterica serovar Portland]|nr:arsenical pump-driving ATPase [Salmonella enterica subsp. enterica serovar Dortmund]ECA8970630.1 arsenical pump-driving ATPase [Salmonella enterica subsp. enterica serovar Omuna]ECE0502462.1 arsenical pump-driving ATPase [Salmonella enterica subsp. enterica]EDH5629523.1 arsenical pump-driving ATPase [Salmonella enterica subsp. enterica serovar Claibornei]EGZ4348328.1 arsenical pump-driving ATPase [Salmonella enterica subsp. enterica serovar Portland]HDC2124362.1 arsenical pump-driving ATPas
MLMLRQVPPFLFFTGKGGVGKTSLACATAIHLTASGKRVLLVSTDPASNVAQVFEQTIGHQITPIAAVNGLSALEVDPSAAAAAYRERIVGPVRGILPDDIVAGIEEQLSGACTTEIAAFDEFTALLTNQQLRDEYDHIVFDTAPTGHTLRMLQLPGAWSGYLDNSQHGASCLGPLAGLEKQRSQYRAAVDALANAELTRMVLVARAQTATLKEVSRTYDELAAIGLTQQYLVINGLLPEQETARDKLAQALYQREQQALQHLPDNLRALPCDRLPLKPFNMVGLAALRGLLDDSSTGTPAEVGDISPVDLPSLSSLIDGFASQGHGLIMLMGKGGVGKTTLAAAIAVELARRGYPVQLSTSDPAAHLTDTLDGSFDGLSVSRIDPQAETERYRQQVMAEQGKNLDEQGRAVLEEDLRSPCTEEIAVFQAFSRIIQEAGKQFVVMDTAPTGHTLLLLDATGAYHREIARLAGEHGQPVLTPMMRLQDSEQTKVLIATLAETTPVLEAAHLQDDLRRAGIEPWGWVINNSLINTPTTSPLLRQRAECERSQIDAVCTHHARRCALVPLQAEEPVGVERLLQLSTTGK